MPSPGNQQALARFLAATRERLARMTVTWVQYEQDRGAEGLGSVLRELHTLKGEAGLLGLAELAARTHQVEGAAQAISEPGRCSDDSSEEILDAFDELVGMLESLAPSQAKTNPRVTKPGGISWKRSTPARATTLDIKIASGERKGKAPTTRPELEKPTTSPRLEGMGEGVFVSAVLVDRIRDLVGDLMLTRARLHGHLGRLEVASQEAQRARELRDDVERMGGLIGGLEELAREVRMVRISQLFDGYHRLVRDLSKELGKEVRLHTEGGSVHVDRDVLDAISEPLLHLLRNAVDHGIEAPDARERSNKGRAGQVSLSASVRGATIEVQVADDGRGIDFSAVGQRAVELGIIDASDVDAIEEEDCLALIFEPGMTTRRVVSGVSGRGIGLDVVRENLAAIGGTISLESHASRGTTFILRAPISFALSSVLLFRVGAGNYALAAGSVLAVVDSEYHEKVEDVTGAKLRYSGDLIPLVSLPDSLSESGDGEAASDADDGERYQSERYIITATGGGGLIALSGATHQRPRDAVLIPLERLQRQRHPVSAGFMLEDGSIALVLNPADLVRRRPRAAPRALAQVAAVDDSVRPTAVLVVDDSALIRELIADVFREHGVPVREAADGSEALNILRKDRDIALVVTDIEMPTMSGLELIAAMRKEPRLRDLPAVVVSTKSSEADQNAARTSGANDYLVKADFSKVALWDKVSRYLGT